MSSVRSLTVTGYKSIRALTDFELNSLNVLIGANGAGKSNFINLFRLLNEMYEQQFQLYVQKQGGPDALLHFGRGATERLHGEFYFDNNGYIFDLVPTSDNRLIFERETSWFKGVRFPTSTGAFLGSGHAESKLKEANDKYSPYVRESVSNWCVYHFHDTSDTAKVKQRHAANDNLRLKIDAANLAAYLRMLRERHEPEYRRIVETIRLVMPFFDDFVHRPGEQEYVELEWRQKGKPDTPFKAHMLSDGSLRFICLATLLLQPIELLPYTTLIDEPELGLHPYAITVLAGIFKQVAAYRQLIVSTQSVELVNELTPDDVVVVDQEEDASTFKRYTQEELSGWLEEYAMGEIWKRNILGGRP
ncbi:MAG: AAA family ATPase [Sulfuricellaceae bacterium]